MIKTQNRKLPQIQNVLEPHLQISILKLNLERIKRERKTEICVHGSLGGVNEKVIAVEFSFSYIQTSKTNIFQGISRLTGT